MTVVMKVVGLVNGGGSPFDGQFLVEYDPERDGLTPDGQPMLAHIVTTPDVSKAMRFGSASEALALWKKVCKRAPVRPDGRPNRPLSAFTVEVGSPEKLGVFT